RGASGCQASGGRFRDHLHAWGRHHGHFEEVAPMTHPSEPASNGAHQLEHDYVSAIEAHLDQETEDSLRDAYELGRRALAQGFGILDVLALYESAQKELVLAASPCEQRRIAVAVTNFFREFLSPFEMSF